MSSERMSFDELVAAIGQAHATLAAQATKAVNISLTLRNWFIGLYIAEYELRGADRAAYGERLQLLECLTSNCAAACFAIDGDSLVAPRHHPDQVQAAGRSAARAVAQHEATGAGIGIGEPRW